jgi:hypothetical protein
MDDISKGWYSQIVPSPATFNIQCAWEVEDNNGDFIMYVSTALGQVFEFNNTELDWLDETGQRRPVTMVLQTAFMRLSANTVDSQLVGTSVRQLEGVTGRITPRFIELRSKERNNASQIWTVLVETADSASENATIRDSKTITFNFLAGQSLQRKSIDPLIGGEFVRVTFTNAELGKDIDWMGSKIWFHARPAQFVVDDTSAAGAGGQN